MPERCDKNKFTVTDKCSDRTLQIRDKQLAIVELAYEQVGLTTETTTSLSSLYAEN